MTQTKPTRFAFMDVLNVVAIFAVMMLHVSLNIFPNAGDTAWNVALVWQCVFIFAVPIFFMVSGANLLGYRERYSTATFFRKRALRVVVTLLVWSAVIYLLLCVAGPLFGYENRAFGPVAFIKQLLTCNVISIYWFFYVIIGLYLVTPIFSMIVGNKQLLAYAIILGAVLTFLVPTAAAFAPEKVNAVVGVYGMRFFTWALVYYLMGYYLTHYWDRTVKPAILIAVCLVCVVAMFGLTQVLNADHVADSYNNLFAAAEGVPTLFYAPALFLLFKQAEPRISASKAYPVWKQLSALSLKVYAVHMVFVWIFDANILTAVTPNTPVALLLQFVVEPLVVYAVSLAVAWALEKAKAALKAAKAAKSA